MHALKDPEENAASENSPGRGNVKIYIFRSRETFWETRFAFLRHMWQAIFKGLYSGGNCMEIMRVLKDPGA